jgi:hypothetical protein
MNREMSETGVLLPAQANFAALRITCRLVLRPTQRSIHWIPAISRPEHEPDHSPLYCRHQECVELYLHSSVLPHYAVRNHRNNFTLILNVNMKQLSTFNTVVETFPTYSAKINCFYNKQAHITIVIIHFG